MSNDVKDEMKWQTLSSEYLLSDTWLTIRKDTCKDRKGRIISPYYVYEFPTWVTAVALTADGKIIMERQYRHALGETHYELPGGCVDATDADLAAALSRELLEETGYQFKASTYLGKISSNPSTNSNWMHMYLVTGCELVQDQQLDHNEDIEVYLLSVDEVKKLLRDNQIAQSMHVTTLLYAFEKLGLLSY